MSAVDTVKASLKRAWSDFRKRSTYFQYKAWIGLVYTLLIVATVIVVVPRSPSNRLKAHVLAARADFVVGSYVLVRNDSARDWENVTFTLNGSHVFDAKSVKAGGQVRVDLKAFTAPSKAPLSDFEVRSLEIKTARGSERYNVTFLAAQ